MDYRAKITMFLVIAEVDPFEKKNLFSWNYHKKYIQIKYARMTVLAVFLLINASSSQVLFYVF